MPARSAAARDGNTSDKAGRAARAWAWRTPARPPARRAGRRGPSPAARGRYRSRSAAQRRRRRSGTCRRGRASAGCRPRARMICSSAPRGGTSARPAPAWAGRNRCPRSGLAAAGLPIGQGQVAGAGANVEDRPAVGRAARGERSAAARTDRCPARAGGSADRTARRSRRTSAARGRRIYRAAWSTGFRGSPFMILLRSQAVLGPAVGDELFDVADPRRHCGSRRAALGGKFPRGVDGHSATEFIAG